MLDPSRAGSTSSRTPVTRERIAEAALHILDSADDRSALTMRTLADALGVQAPSLYAHISGVNEVWSLVHALINASIDLSPLFDEEPLEGLRVFAHHYRRAYKSHPVAATIIITGAVVNEDHALAVYEPVAACLGRAGIPPAQVMPFMAVLDNLALGSAIEPFAEGFTGRSSSYAARFPHLAEALLASNRRHIDDEGFELGLSAYLDLVRACAS